MPLTDAEQADVRKYLGVSQSTATEDPVAERLDAALAALTASGELAVRELLGMIAPMWLELPAVRESFAILRVGAIEFNAGELEQRVTLLNFTIGRLWAVLFPAYNVTGIRTLTVEP